MGKKYLGTKENSLESSILGVWKQAVEESEVARAKQMANLKKQHSSEKEDEKDELTRIRSNESRQLKDPKKEMMVSKGGKVMVIDKTKWDQMKKKGWIQAEAAERVNETNKNDKSDDGEGLDAVQPKAVKKKFKDRKDKDIDNDGDTDDSDKFLHKRRKAVSKAMKDEGLEDSPNPANKQHLCAKNVMHEEWGQGNPVYGMHADPDEDGNIAWYDVMFEHGVEKRVVLNELKVTETGMHASHDKDKEKLIAKHRKEGVEEFAVPPDVPAMEVGTDRYRDYTLEVTPGQEDPEWVKARDFKVASMKEALAKVWGLAEKKAQTKEEEEEDEELKPVKGSKTMTGGKPAKVEINPKAP